jgi:signal transduction histidine kinase
MAASRFSLRFSRRVLTVIGLGVALPALLLAGLGIHLTLQIARAVEDESARYNSYMALQVGEAFEQDLMALLRRAIVPAENVARAGGDRRAVLDALASASGEFESPDFVPLDSLNGYSLIIVESQPLIFAPGEGRRAGRFFVGLLLRDAAGQVIGAGGWWMNPREFLVRHLREVTQDLLPANPRLYGGFESTRKLSVTLVGPMGEDIARARQPGNTRTARIEPLAGPFEGYSVRVAGTSSAPAVLTTRFVALELTFIGLMGLAIVLATAFGLRYTIRQLELAQIKAGFVSNVTHELKTPIALIRLAVETLELRRVSSVEETDKFLRTIGRETLRLQQLVDNILDFARLEAGQRVFRFETLDLLAIVRDAVESFRPRFEHLGFKLELQLPESLPPVRGDAVAISHCVLNLLDNALKYSKERREVRVTAEDRGEWVAVTVADRGMGIAPADRKRIFEKFVRLETGLVHDVKGTGLGLSLVDQIVRAHGGRVELVSSPGEGSAFTIVLPRAGGAEASRIEPRQQTGS